MPYQITITKLEENLNYDAQLQEAEKTKNYNRGYGMEPTPYPEKMLVAKKLDTVLTDEEFDAVRKACLGAI